MPAAESTHMIPGASGAAAAGILLVVFCALLGAGLLAWWAWRQAHAWRGTPRPALRAWQWVLAVVLSVPPIATGVGLGLMALQNMFRAQHELAQERWRHLTLAQPQAWGDVPLPAGSHVERSLPAPWLVVDTSIPAERPDGSPDLDYLSAVRFAQPVQIGPLWVRALSVYPPLMELDRPYAPGGAHCQAGALVQWQAREPATLDAMHANPKPGPLRLADWQVEDCFLGDPDPIRLRYWKGAQLVWATRGSESAAH